MKFVALSRVLVKQWSMYSKWSQKGKKEEGHKLEESRGSIRLEIMTKSKNCYSRNSFF